MTKHFFTSESVTEWHPDKICDQISDAVLDAVLKDDPNWACCCETFITKWLVVVGWEITTKAILDISDIVKSVLTKIGYTKPEYGIDVNACQILNVIQQQSPDIAQWEIQDDSSKKEQWAWDQWMMFGFACRETDEYMPLPITLAHNLCQKLSGVRKSGELSYLRPDGKSQVTVEYDNGLPTRIDTIVIAAQHDENIDLIQLRKDIKNHIIIPVCGDLLDENTKFHINETGRFVIWWPEWDTGLTGRKIIVDTYWGYSKHWWWAFSWKVPNKQDRSGAYIARYIAKNIVAARLADKLEIQISYAIWFSQPTSINVNSFWTGKRSDSEIEKIIFENFDLSPRGIIQTLDLRRPIYFATAAYGHFGRSEFPWEKLDKVENLKKYL